jgi:hypothetical protein
VLLDRRSEFPWILLVLEIVLETGYSGVCQWYSWEIFSTGIEKEFEKSLIWWE